MATLINIRLMGTVAIYDDGSNWNLIFITDKDHQFIISDPSGAHPDQRIRNGKNRVLKLSAGQVNDTGRGYSNNAKTYALNMSADYLHDVDPKTKKSNLNRTDSPGPGRELITITVPYGIIDCAAYPSSDHAPDYWIKNMDTGESKQRGGPVAKFLTLTFQDDSGTQLELISGDPTEAAIDPWKYSSDVLNLIFNNDCLGAGSADDFMHYYDCVRDKRDNKIMFTAGKLGGGVMSSQGDCDPAIIQPPPDPGY